MKQKFSTLVAGFLLAGGLFGSANAISVKDAESGHYYKVVRVLGGKSSSSSYVWNKVTDGYALDEQNGKFGLSKASDDCWTVTGDATKGFTFKNLAGKTFKFSGESAFKINTVSAGTGTSAVAGDQLQGTNWVATAGKTMSAFTEFIFQTGTEGTDWMRAAFDLTETSLSYQKNAADLALANGMVAYIFSNNTKVGDAKYVVTYKDGVFSLKTLEDGKDVALRGVKEFTVAQKVGASYLFAVNGDETLFIGLDADGALTVVDDVTKASLLTFRDVEIESLTAGELNYFEKNGFSMSIKGQATDGKWTVDLKDNFFNGHLTPMTFNGSKFVAAAGNAEIFYLKNAAGKYVVVNSDLAAGLDNADQFVEVAEADLKRDILKTGEQKYNGQYKFYYSTATVDKKKVSVIDHIELYSNDQKPVLCGTLGRLDFKNVPYLAIQPKGNTAINLLPIQIKLGSDLIKDWKEVLAQKFFTVEDITANAKRGFKVANCDGSEWAAAATIGNDLEKQWALTFVNGEYLFTNRENVNATFTLPDALYKTGTDYTYNVHVYEYTWTDEDGTKHDVYKDMTVVIKPVEGTKATDGYKILPDVKNNKFYIGYWSGTYGEHAWFSENHATDHQIGLNIDKDAASVWTAKEYNKEYKEWENPVTYETEHQTSDSIYVISQLGYINADGKYATQPDTLKVVAYSFENQYGESLFWADTYLATKNGSDKYALRKDHGYYNIRLVGAGKAANDRYYVFEGCGIKTYSGDAADGILSNTGLYTRTENDLFDVVETEHAMYRRVINPMDTISIFRNDNKKSVLFESGKFLGMENLVQYPAIAPGMIADTAYVRYNTYRPQYMLVVNANITDASEDLCEICGQPTCEHSKSTTGSVEGRFLVNLKDTAIAWDNAHQHKADNPYVNTEKYYRLGFVQATHRNDSLIVAEDNHRIFVGGEDFNVAKFAFKYVDPQEGSFRIETADYYTLDNATNTGKLKPNTGWVKWMNGVVVVVPTEKDGDIFNMDEEFEGTPTANEGIATAGVSVVATEGAVIVKGAEGKKVVISNVLGQAIANKVIASSEATIVAPAGVVVVAVEGEDAVKAIVK